MLAAIMVHVDFDEGAEHRISVAASLADRFNSALIGIAGWPPRKNLVVLGRSRTTGAVVDAVLEFEAGEEGRQKISAQLERLGEKFRRIAKVNGRSTEWRSFVNFPSEVIAREARAADLVIIGRDPLPGDDVHTFDPGTVILAAGRPVLVVPSGIRHLEAERILIAWKDTREARRTVSDALPFLKKAQSVNIVEVSEQGMEDPARERIADVAKYLARHHVAIGTQIATAGNRAEGPLLLRLAKEQKADLIIAGAYGRTRLGEWIFGGVTRELLAASEVCCLFSH